MTTKTAILVVNGGEEMAGYHWLSFYLQNLSLYTALDLYDLYIWNNNTDDPLVLELQREYGFELIEPLVTDKLIHEHASALQRLFKIALSKQKYKTIVLMDTDAIPIDSNWLQILRSEIEQGNCMSGVWRDEIDSSIEPYIHPSCMIINSAWLSDSGKRLDSFECVHGRQRADTMSVLTDFAQSRNDVFSKFTRSNRNNYHHLIGGIYGDIIYHHGAGSRKVVRFWDDDGSIDQQEVKLTNRKCIRLLFDHTQAYFDWLNGESTHASIESLYLSKYDNASFREKFVRQILKVFNNTPTTSVKVTSTAAVKFSAIDGLPNGKHFQSIGITRGATTCLPGIIGLGVPKGGTSWWFHNLISHPDIVPHIFYDENLQTAKELFYFMHEQPDDVENYTKRYRDCFHAHPGVVTAELTTTYLHDCNALDRILKVQNKSMKFVIILRNPVDRYYSHLNHYMYNRTRRLNLSANNIDYLKTFSYAPEANFYSLYADKIEYLFNHLPREQVYIDTYENIANDPLQAYLSFLEFCGLPEFVDDKHDFFRPRNKIEYVIPRPSNEEKKALMKHYESDISRLQSINKKVDVMRWLDFR